jgi:hypothetical protein
MTKKTAYNVRLLRRETGDQHDRLIIAQDETKAGARAIERAKASLETMVDRKYAHFDVLSCAPASPHVRGQ